MIYFDKWSQIGSTHKENEDFAVIGDEENPFIIVSDGCSSSEDTSTGSRLLSLCVSECYKQNPWHLPSIGFNSISRAFEITKKLGLKNESLDATIMIADICEDKVRVCIWGDGYVFLKYKDSSLFHVKTIEYTPEMPYYLSYITDNNRNANYCKCVSNGEIHKIIDDDGNFYPVPVHVPTEFSFIKNDLEFIILSTDGAGSFIDSENNPIHQEDIENQITSFKRINGEFIQRRMRRMMKMNAKEGIKHYDDLTIAGMSFVD